MKGAHPAAGSGCGTRHGNVAALCILAPVRCRGLHDAGASVEVREPLSVTVSPQVTGGSVSFTLRMYDVLPVSGSSSCSASMAVRFSGTS